MCVCFVFIQSVFPPVVVEFGFFLFKSTYHSIIRLVKKKHDVNFCEMRAERKVLMVSLYKLSSPARISYHLTENKQNGGKLLQTS